MRGKGARFLRALLRLFLAAVFFSLKLNFPAGAASKVVYDAMRDERARVAAEFALGEVCYCAVHFRRNVNGPPDIINGCRVLNSRMYNEL